MADISVFDAFAVEFNKLYEMQTEGNTQGIFIQYQRNKLNELGRKVIFAALEEKGYTKKVGKNGHIYLERPEVIL